ncbi:MAG: methyltransferase domain-containing protein [Candidatus Hydrogenedentota bacterium]
MSEHSTEYDYDSIDAGYYDKVYHRATGSQSKWHHLKFRHVRRAMPDTFDKHLDIACGPGTFIGSLTDPGHSLGTDIAQAQVDYASSQYTSDNHEFQCVPPGPLPFEDDRFDAVTLIELIEHLEVQVVKDLLTEVRRVLKPGGKVVLTTPNYGSLWPLLEIAVNRMSELSYEDQHINLFKKARLKQTLQEVGFEEPSVTTFQGLAPFSAAIHWKLADAWQRIENPILQPALGFLLLGEGFAPKQ